MTPADVTTHVQIGDDGLAFTIRTWFSLGGPGWLWTARAEDHDLVVESRRTLATSQSATEVAVATLERRFA